MRASPGRGLWCRAALPLLAMAGSVAAEAPGFYVSGGIGAGYAPNGSLDGVNGKVDFDLGRPIAGVAVGFARAGGWRFELDGTYRYNDSEVVFFDDGTPDLPPDSDSTLTAVSGALSVIYDFRTGLGFRPYLGAGAGAAKVDFEITEYITGEKLLDDDDTALAYQLIAGFTLEMTRRMDLAVDYRYWHAPDIQLDAVDGPIDTGHRVHSAMMSLRYRPWSAARPAAGRREARAAGWYLRAQGGASFAKDAEIKNNIANFDAFDVGGVASVAAGRTLGRRWRLELEGAARRNEAELVDFNPEFGEDRADGRVRSWSLMANAVYEPAWNTAFRPYAGLGVGMAWSDWEVELQTEDRVYVDDADTATAAQVFFGAAARVSERVEVSAEFRYWITGLFDLEEPDGRPMRTELAVSSLMLGLRYTLGQP